MVNPLVLSVFYKFSKTSNNCPHFSLNVSVNALENKSLS